MSPHATNPPPSLDKTRFSPNDHISLIEFSLFSWRSHFLQCRRDKNLSLSPVGKRRRRRLTLIDFLFVCFAVLMWRPVSCGGVKTPVNKRRERGGTSE